jgi:hypothetical protein
MSTGQAREENFLTRNEKTNASQILDPDPGRDNHLAMSDSRKPCVVMDQKGSQMVPKEHSAAV